MRNIEETAGLTVRGEVLYEHGELIVRHNQFAIVRVPKVRRPTILSQEVVTEHSVRGIRAKSIYNGNVGIVPETSSAGEPCAHYEDKQGVPQCNYGCEVLTQDNIDDLA